MKLLAGWRAAFRLAVLVYCLAGSAGIAATPSIPLRLENRRREVAQVFHPQGAATRLEQAGEPLLLLSQTVSAVIIIGGLLARMRKEEAQLDGIASMMLRVFFIASLPLWKECTLSLADASADALGSRAIPSASLRLDATVDRQASTPLLERIWALGEQWTLDSSPLQDSLEGSWTPQEAGDEAHLAQGWNWTKPAQAAAQGAGEQVWSAATNAERAGLLHRFLLCIAAGVQLAYHSFYLAEYARLLLFHAGCALAPLCIAGLGTHALRVPSLRALLGLVAVAFWPLAWGVVNVGTLSMADGLLQVIGWINSSAMYPKIEGGAAGTLAVSAPYLSWSTLLSAAMMTLCLCLWVLGGLVAGAWCVHRLLSSGAACVDALASAEAGA